MPMSVIRPSLWIRCIWLQTGHKNKAGSLSAKSAPLANGLRSIGLIAATRFISTPPASGTLAGVRNSPTLFLVTLGPAADTSDGPPRGSQRPRGGLLFSESQFAPE